VGPVQRQRLAASTVPKIVDFIFSPGDGSTGSFRYIVCLMKKILENVKCRRQLQMQEMPENDIGDMKNAVSLIEDTLNIHLCT